MQIAISRLSFFLFFTILITQESSSQGALTFDLKKPEKFENKKLGSEKTGEKKFTVPRRFIQNTFTHYNWYFNANNKLNEVINRAKAAHQDDYSTLLPFYNYSFENITRDKSELDSVIYKATTGILIHDLRNDWIDNLYLLMGKAYYYKEEFDSAYLTFQYINYAFAPKESDGYDIPIGSNTKEGGNAFSISTKENRTLPKKILSAPPSRNESLVWQVRTYIAHDELPEASGLIETLRHDPAFPARLKDELNELQAWWFYKQEMYDSAAIYLERALPSAVNKQEVARWEYLIAQLYEHIGKQEEAQAFYDRTIQHTLNPVLEVYARLNSIRQHTGDSLAIQKSIEALLKMGNKDRYSSYRDIIYYTAAQIELERNNVTGAKWLLIRSTKAKNLNPLTGQRTKSFLQLAELSFAEKNYIDAQRYYDSINIPDPVISDAASFGARKVVLTRIREQLEIISRQDSLQRIAGLPDVQREAFVRKLAKQLRKSQGLKEETGTSSANNIDQDFRNPPADLFGSNVKGEWYFYNPSLKAKGYSDFKNKWGNRPNIDNWRRITTLNQVNNQPEGLNKENMALKPAILADDMSYEGLVARLPLQPLQLAASNDSIEQATATLGTLYMEGLEDYVSAITVFRQFLEKYPTSTLRPEVLFQLYYCYTKTGQVTLAKSIEQELKQKYPASTFQQLIDKAINGNKPDTAAIDMRKRYDSIYNSFIEGNFEKAMLEKKSADSLYSNNYWTPQLLYIQAIYQVKQRMDDSAKTTLRQISALYPNSPLSAKAQTMLDVVSRRKEIEQYLTTLHVENPASDSMEINKKDSISTKMINPSLHPVVKNVPTARPPLKQPQKITDSAQLKTNIPVVPPKAVFTFAAEVPYAVVVVLDKVDPVYISESRNAFNRYNKEKYYNRTIVISNEVVNEQVKLVVMNGFENAAVALDYLEKARKSAAGDIIPWLPADKYSFIIISMANLEVLKNTKDLSAYKKFLTQYFPGKF